MSYSVYGVIKDADGNGVEGIKVYPYFKKVDSGSDDSKWADEYYETDDTGYYAYSPEDNILLGSEGSYKKTSDKFYCAFMFGGGETLDALDMQYVFFHKHTIPNADDSEINLTVEKERNPVFSESVFPEADLLTKQEYEMSEESHVDTSWKSADYGEDRSQKFTFDTVSIFDGHQLIKTIYDWDEIDDREVDNNSSDKYTFQNAGDYVLKMRIREKWDTFTEVTKDVRVKYNEPVVDFDWTPTETSEGKIKGQEEITFHNNTADADNRTDDNYTFKWVIEDKDQDDNDNTDTYEDKDADFEPTKKYQSEGDKKITLTCYWNDGFEDKETSTEKTLQVYPFEVSPDFDISDDTPISYEVEVLFDNTTGDVDSKQEKLDWIIDDYYNIYNPNNENYGDSETDNHTELKDQDIDKQQSHYFQSKDDHNVKLVVHYSDGWKSVTDETTKVISFTVYTISPKITHDDTDFVGKIEVVYRSEDTTDRAISEDWSWDDKTFPEEDENITARAEEDVGSDQPFTYQYPSRKPFSAKDGAEEDNPNKKVTLKVRYNDGYEDNIYESVEKVFEAIPYEVALEIFVEENIDNHTH